MKRLPHFIAIFILGVLAAHYTDDALRYLFVEKQYGIEAPDGTKHYVPEEIADARDCEAFQKWTESLIEPGFVPTIHPCPWTRRLGGIGKFTLNGVEFHIPREYLWQGRDDPDGPAKDDKIYMLMQYPDMTPGKFGDSNSGTIKVTLEPISKDVKSDVVYGYKLRSGLMFDESENNQPIFIKSLGGGMDYYEVPLGGETKDVFLWGDPLAPDDWQVCELLGCYTVFKVTPKIKADVHYMRSGFYYRYDEVKKLVSERVQSFVIKHEGN